MQKKYLVDECTGTKYYQTIESALKRYFSNKQAHTLAYWNGEKWIVINEKNFSSGIRGKLIAGTTEKNQTSRN